MQTTRLIEDYLDGVLPAEEHAAVESRAANDSAFKELIRLHREVNESIKDREFATLKMLTDKIGSEWVSPATKSRHITPGFLRIAAIFILLAGAAALIKILFIDADSAQQIYKKYYRMYDSGAASRAAAEDKHGIDLAVIYYSQGKFNEAFAVLDELTTKENLNYLAWFYKGMTSLELNDPTNAIHSFKTIPDSWANVYREHRDWYLALALLKNNNTDEAAKRFKAISDARGYYAERSSEILEKLAD